MIHLMFLMVLASSSFSKTDYFKVFSGNDQASVSQLIIKLENTTPSKDQSAYLGALKMKQAQFVQAPKDRLALFKEGRTLLEKMISQNANNAEYRFLRLMIQENAPKILNYDDKIREDAKLIKAQYAHLSSEVRSAALQYSKRSSNLKL
jgi:hypothetical protein